MNSKTVAVIGGGPAGLMAAEALIGAGVSVEVFDAMPSVGRKFLLAGKGGMNLTHSEPAESFLSRYGARRAQIALLLDGFGPKDLRDWVHGLGIDTFVGSSGRVFPTDMKAAPLLRAWLHRLREAGVRFHMRHRWLGWDDWNGNGALCFATPDGDRFVHADATVLALGGASWARLGSDGAWVPLLEQQGVSVAALRPSNCGFDIGWSEHFCTRFAGHPVKAVVASFTDTAGRTRRRQGEFVVTSTGVEGSLIYALSAALRDEIAATGAAVIHLDLAPGKELQSMKWRIRAARARWAAICKAGSASPVSRRACCARLYRRKTFLTLYAWPRRSRRCRCAWSPRVRSMKQSAAPAASDSNRSMSARWSDRCRVCSARGRCWTGKRQPGVICSPPVSRAAAARVWERRHGFKPAAGRRYVRRQKHRHNNRLNRTCGSDNCSRVQLLAVF
jgi:uncharacterized flavoprotein (TIGR03862 family)